MGWQQTEERTLHITTNALKVKNIDGNVFNAGTVIVYGDIKGNVHNCDNVIVINGDVYGEVSFCGNVAGLLADKAVRCHTGGADE